MGKRENLGPITSTHMGQEQLLIPVLAYTSKTRVTNHVNCLSDTAQSNKNICYANLCLGLVQ